MRTQRWVSLILSVAVFAAGLADLLIPYDAADSGSFAPAWLPLAAAGVAAMAMIVGLTGHPSRLRLRRGLEWSSLLLMLWTASELPFDLLRVASLIVPGLMPPGVDWAGLAARALALAALVMLARLVLARPAATPARAARWYGCVAFALALPYPLLKTWWAFGGSLGLRWPGAGGLAGSFALWLPAVPWLVAAGLSLLLVVGPRWMPRRLLLAAGWSATAIGAMVGLAGCWSLLTGLVSGDADFGDMSGWVFGLVYASWLLWAVAAAAATRSYQLRRQGPLVAS